MITFHLSLYIGGFFSCISSRKRFYMGEFLIQHCITDKEIDINNISILLLRKGAKNDRNG